MYNKDLNFKTTKKILEEKKFLRRKSKAKWKLLDEVVTVLDRSQKSFRWWLSVLVLSILYKDPEKKPYTSFVSEKL